MPHVLWFSTHVDDFLALLKREAMFVPEKSKTVQICLSNRFHSKQDNDENQNGIDISCQYFLNRRKRAFTFINFHHDVRIELPQIVF